MPQAHALEQRYEVLHRFRGSPDDGATPEGAFAGVGDELYGTTAQGGSSFAGTVFAINASGQERVLYNFTGDPDGFEPLAGPIAVRGSLFGTTFYGGATEHGSVFEVGETGKERVLYSFKGLSDARRHAVSEGDGSGPQSGLVALNGMLYGTTSFGGMSAPCCDNGCGTLFALNPLSGNERVLHRFRCRSDGEDPTDLVAMNGNLYGTTLAGGTGNCNDAQGCGTVFEIATSGHERTLFRFGGGPAGEYPGTLVPLNGVLYGITYEGGDFDCSVNGCGTVFDIDASGKERTLYAFHGQPDGANPNDLIAAGGALYGTTALGGTKNDGTIFDLSFSGDESVLYSFSDRKGKAGTDGASPLSLVRRKDTFYGSSGGGDPSCSLYHEVTACGLVFAFRSPQRSPIAIRSRARSSRRRTGA
jgi:uncharacterized repeat protein (TIGR03803 family)